MDATPAPYGHDLEPDLHGRLRSDPPAAALDWVCRETGARRVLSCTALSGGTSSAMHLLVLELGPGAQRALVLRRYVLDWVLEEPEAPGNEVRVLRHLEEHLDASVVVPAPRLVAADVDAATPGVPMVLMTARSGELVWRPGDLDAWLDALVATMVDIHAVPVSDELARWYPYAPELVPPPWTRHGAAWDRAVEAYHGERPSSESVFLHRDFHPGNVLWTHGQVSGVVDWVSSCVGPAEEDVAHCRANLAQALSFEVADEFLRRWQRVTGRGEGWDPYWDLVDVVSTGTAEPDPTLDAWVARIAAV